MGLLRFLLIAIAILWVVRIIARLVLPMLFQNLMNKAHHQGGERQYRERNSRKPEGAIHVDFIPPKAKEAKAADKAGEFIDYEEIK